MIALLSRGVIGALLGALLGGAALAFDYSRHPVLTLEMDRSATVVRGLYGAERAGHETFAWTRDRATMHLPQLDRRTRPWWPLLPATVSSLIPEVMKRAKAPCPSGTPRAAYRAFTSSRAACTMRWSTVSTERWPAIASTASLMARTAPLDRSLIAGSTIGRARPGCIGRGAETGLGPSTQGSHATLSRVGA